ncbi:MAG: Nucleoside triphosphate pyrophosphohydrolase/pyrophosphatase MazG [Firmicutes bacterium ADurb.Bin099]|nr:MAG: Nucleoside triphosphate pyrophosphohydrolase/pyrophosphatase MazG [Firmicutes bacterium ADurb.Bin099]
MDKHDKKYDFNDLVEIMAKLRSDSGCPWDKEQTHESITTCLIEEAYETCDAIIDNDIEKMTEELGDVLLQVVFHAQIGKENGTFDLSDITDGICRKLIFRHPHIFGDKKMDTAEQVLESWERIKIKEKGYKSEADSMSNIPKTFPALMRANKIQSKAERVGFDWPDVWGAFDKVYEEAHELKRAIETEDTEKQKEEAGDLLFAVVNVCRFLDIDPEQSLDASSDKFIKRFSHVENSCNDKGQFMKEMTLEQLDKYWNEAKNENR